jgi:hypothetical protein
MDVHPADSHPQGDRASSHATTLASGQSGPTSVAVDATSVYWTNSVNGTVMKVSKL